MFFLFIFLFSSCETLRNSPHEHELPGRYYRVRSGDTLESISKKQRISQEEILETNGIDNPGFLRIGQELFLPAPDPIGTKVVNLTRNKSQKQELKTTPANFTLLFPVPHGRIKRKFSRSKAKPYDGIAISAPRGSQVLAAQKGRVLFVGDDGTKFGLIIILEHENNIITVYTHLEKALVKAHQEIKQKEPIGLVGTSGGVSSPLLHFQVRVNQRPQNPLDFIISQFSST